VLAHARSASGIARLKAFPAAIEGRVLDARLPNGVPLLVLDCPSLYRRAGGLCR
jgi:starch synthase